MTLNDIPTMTPVWNPDFNPGYLIKVTVSRTEWWRFSVRRQYKLGTWIIGILHEINKASRMGSGWACAILAMDSDHKWLQLPISDTDNFEPIEPVDLVKYINHLTDAGANYLKEMKI